MAAATNVAGQALIPTLMAKRNHILDVDVYNSASVDAIEPDRDRQPEPELVPAG